MAKPKVTLHYENLEDAENAIRADDLIALLHDIHEWLTTKAPSGGGDWFAAMLAEKAKRRDVQHIALPQTQKTEEG